MPIGENLPGAMLMRLTRGAPDYATRYFLTTEIYVERCMDSDIMPTDKWLVCNGDIFDNGMHEREKDGRVLDTVDTQQLLVFIAHKTLWETIMHNDEEISRRST